MTYAVFDRSKEIWISTPLKEHYYLHDNAAGDWSMVFQPDFKIGSEYLDSEKLKEAFPDTPPYKYPPFGGTAAYWIKDPKKWKAELGWRIWHCTLKTETHYQQFENGIIIGILPTMKGNVIDQQGQIFTLIRNSRWYSYDVPVSNDKVPRCEDNSPFGEE